MLLALAPLFLVLPPLPLLQPLTPDDVAIGEREIQSVMQMVHYMVKKNLTLMSAESLSPGFLRVGNWRQLLHL